MRSEGVWNSCVKTKLELNDLWERHGAHAKGQDRHGLSVSEAIEQTDALIAAESMPCLDAWLTIYDEFTSWFISLTNIFEFELHDPQSPSRDIVPALTTLLAAIVAHLFAIRRLTVAGLDLAAKQVLRSLREYVDLGILLVMRPQLASEFVAAQTPDESNHFWFKYVSKNKASKYIYDHGYPFISQPYDRRELSSWRKTHDDILSMSAHPSYLAGAIRLLIAGSDHSWPSYFGKISGGSVQTLYYSVLTLLDFLLMTRHLPFDNQDELPALIKYEKENEFHRHVEIGRYVLAELILRVNDGSLDDELSSPDMFADWENDVDG